MGTAINKTRNADLPERLRHYTSVENLYKILTSGTLLLGSPKRWPDKNDAASLEAFCRLTGAAKVRVLCFANGDELIHHWSTYARMGCCINFDTAGILELAGQFKLLHKKVIYRPMEDLTLAALRTIRETDLAFIKRRPYECEKEYRIVWAGGAKENPPAIPVFSLIHSVTLSPYIKDIKRGEIKTKLEKKYRLKNIQYSRLLQNDKWISKFENIK